jgi:DNA-binding CsgD family transcriptional regulator
MAGMSQQENRVCDWQLTDRVDGNATFEEGDVVRHPPVRAHAVDEASAMIVRQLNGPLTALLLYMEEIKHHSLRPPHVQSDPEYLRRVVDNALQQTERVCALVQKIAGAQVAAETALSRNGQQESCPAQGRCGQRPGAAPFAPEVPQKPLTKREREVLNLISEGYSNKQGALRMQISPRTFESHRAEAMRKLGARNTADLVRAALLHPID